jgi:PAS domain S-box-containing protein
MAEITYQELAAENERLRNRLRELTERLREPEEIIRAIRSGEVDAFVVEEPPSPKIYALRKPDLLFRAMVEQMKEAAVALDPSGVVVYSNPCFSQLLETETREVVGRRLGDLVPVDSEAFFEKLDELAPGKGRRAEIVMRTHSGRRIPMQASMSAASTECGTVICVLLSDLADQKRRDALLVESERKDQFLAMLAHELRNPLAPVKNAAEILKARGGSDPTITWATQIISRQIAQLTRLVDDLLDVSRITRNKIRLELKPLDLSLVIAGAVESARPLLQSRGQEVDLTLHEMPVYVRGDETRLTQVLANVLNNAAKFSPEKGKILIRVAVEGSEVEIAVQDHGIGIAPRMLPSIFELFAQVDSSASRSNGGLGVGLSLARDLVQMHGGHIEAKSDGEGKGTTILIRLPVLENFVHPLPVDSQPKNAAQEGKRVLIVDDNLDAAESLAELLSLSGHEVVTAESGASAFEKVQGFKPDVIFLDIGLPDIDGYEVARRLRRTHGGHDFTLIALTGYGRDDDRRRAAEAGFDAHQIKPVNIEQVDRLLRTVKTPRPTARSR